MDYFTLYHFGWRLRTPARDHGGEEGKGFYTDTGLTDGLPTTI